MADFSIASQIRPMQLPDPLQQYAQFNQLALHQAQLAEVQRAANEQNQLRSLLETGVDRNSPEFLKQVYKISPTTGMTLEKGQNELKTAGLTQQKLTGDIAAQTPALQKAQIENMVADHKLYSEMLNKVLALPDDQAKTAYEMLRAGAVSKYKDLDAAWPAAFDRGVLEKQMLTAEQTAQAQAAERLANQPTVSTVAGMPPMIVNKQKGTFSMAQEAPSGGAPAAAGAPFAVPVNTPAAVRQQPPPLARLPLHPPLHPPLRLPI